MKLVELLQRYVRVKESSHEADGDKEPRLGRKLFLEQHPTQESDWNFVQGSHNGISCGSGHTDTIERSEIEKEAHEPCKQVFEGVIPRVQAGRGEKDAHFSIHVGHGQ